MPTQTPEVPKIYGAERLLMMLLNAGDCLVEPGDRHLLDLLRQQLVLLFHRRRQSSEVQMEFRQATHDS